MPNITTEYASDNFAKVVEDAQHDPIFISKDGEIAVVMLSWDAFRRVVTRDRPKGVRPAVERALTEMIEGYGDVFRARSKFD